jgi:hypothetical protein
MTRRCTLSHCAGFQPSLVGELEQVRLLGGSVAFVRLEDLLRPVRVVLALRGVRVAPDVVGGAIERLMLKFVAVVISSPLRTPSRMVSS